MGVTLLVYRYDAQAELGPIVVNTTSTAASDSVSFTCASLVSANAQDSHFQHWWAYLRATTGANLAACRSVANDGGYDPSSGSVTAARAWSTAVTSGMGFELSSKLPAVTDDLGVRGIREIVNDVMLSMPPIDLLPVTGVTAQGVYDLTTLYPWLTEKSQILGIYFQDTNDELPLPTGIRWEWVLDVDAPKLYLPSEPFTTGQTFYIKARRPALTWIRTGGTWAADTDGLQNDTDEALPLRKVVRAQVLAEAYRTLMTMDGPGEYRAYYRDREAHWLGVAASLKWWDRPGEDEDVVPRPKMVFFSSPYGSARSYR